jgi:hypothetical protein
MGSVTPTEVTYTRLNPEKKNKVSYHYKKRYNDNAYPISIIDIADDVEIVMSLADMEWLIDCHINEQKNQEKRENG